MNEAPRAAGESSPSGTHLFSHKKLANSYPNSVVATIALQCPGETWEDQLQAAVDRLAATELGGSDEALEILVEVKHEHGGRIARTAVALKVCQAAGLKIKDGAHALRYLNEWLDFQWHTIPPEFRKGTREEFRSQYEIGRKSKTIPEDLAFGLISEFLGHLRLYPRLDHKTHPREDAE